MKGDHTQRWTNGSPGKVGSDEFEYIDVGSTAAKDIRNWCKRQADEFDKECHQYPRTTGNGNPRYGDYTDGSGNTDGTQCNNWTTDEEESFCLGQDCMFDYCILRRNQYMEDCLALAEDWRQ